LAAPTSSARKRTLFWECDGYRRFAYESTIVSHEPPNQVALDNQALHDSAPLKVLLLRGAAKIIL
jgi:hypothetical protein